MPSMRMWPAAGSTSRVSADMSDDLPAPAIDNEIVQKRREIAAQTHTRTAHDADMLPGCNVHAHALEDQRQAGRIPAEAYIRVTARTSHYQLPVHHLM